MGSYWLFLDLMGVVKDTLLSFVTSFWARRSEILVKGAASGSFDIEADEFLALVVAFDSWAVDSVGVLMKGWQNSLFTEG